eukprot:6473770-Amphidinium_carterae.1
MNNAVIKHAKNQRAQRVALDQAVLRAEACRSKLLARDVNGMDRHQHGLDRHGPVHRAESILDVKLTRSHPWISVQSAHHSSSQKEASLALAKAKLSPLQMRCNQGRQSSHKRLGVYLLEECREQDGANPILSLA